MLTNSSSFCACRVRDLRYTPKCEIPDPLKRATSGFLPPPSAGLHFICFPSPTLFYTARPLILRHSFFVILCLKIYSSLQLQITMASTARWYNTSTFLLQVESFTIIKMAVSHCGE
ncbi:unnamed protein product [Choristocarpus tenellus]